MQNASFLIRSILSRLPFVIILFIFLQLTATAVKAEPTLDWELVNPFRFIRDVESIDELRRVYDGLSEKNAYNLERALQDLSEAEIDKKREEARRKYKCDTTKKEEEKQQCFAAYEGWFARLANNNYIKTCWEADSGEFRKERECVDYIYPKAHKIRVWITGLQIPESQLPQWFVDKQSLTETKYKNCADKYQKGICIEFDVEYDSTESKSKEISVIFPGNEIAIAPVKVQIKDKLIIGLGDSYAAGEGNPDIPAQFAIGKTDVDFSFYSRPVQLMPQKDNNPEVAWLDKRCHRSMYSYQFKTALQLALANPRQAVTYVSFACSGGTTGNIIKDRQTPNEGRGKVTPQLELLKEVLIGDKKNGRNSDTIREIDYLLLSTGGNDIGFAKYVAYVVTSGAASIIVGRQSTEETEKIIRETLLTGRNGNKGNYPQLHAALLNKDGIKIKGCKQNMPCKRILLSAYPNIFNDENGKICKADRKEFEIPFGVENEREERVKMAKQYVFEPLQKTQRDKLITSELGWTVITSHSDKYLKHGFCAQNSKSPSLTGESFVMPRREDKKWQPFNPWDYKSYEVRQRWVRLPIDSKLTTDQVHMFWKFPLDLFFEDDRSNIMHPTAEGLTETANANFEMIMNLEAD